MKLLRWIFRHRYRIDLVVDDITPEGRYVVRERPWWTFVFPVYLHVASGKNMEGAMETIEWHKKQTRKSVTVYKN
jgi:hypothetical protein